MSVLCFTSNTKLLLFTAKQSEEVLRINKNQYTVTHHLSYRISLGGSSAALSLLLLVLRGHREPSETFFRLFALRRLLARSQIRYFGYGI